MPAILAFLLAFFSSLTVSAAVDGAERVEGATGVAAALGFGNLTAGFSERGELTVLRWPGPGSADHLTYRTSPDGRYDANGEYAPFPRLGARENAGAFMALMVETTDETRVLFLRDEEWTTNQHYTGNDSMVLRTEHAHAALGLAVVEEVLVHPTRNLLLWRVTLTRETFSPVLKVRLLFFENLAPVSETRYTQLRQNYLDKGTDPDVNSDYGVLFEAEAGLLWHFVPEDKNDTSLKTVVDKGASQSDIRAYLDTPEGAFSKPGVFFAFGANRDLEIVQCGNDTMIDPSEQTLEDAYASLKNGTLSRRLAAYGQVDAVLGTAWLSLDEPVGMTLALGAAAQADEARLLVQTALNPQDRRQAADGDAEAGEQDAELVMTDGDMAEGEMELPELEQDADLDPGFDPFDASAIEVNTQARLWLGHANLPQTPDQTVRDALNRALLILRTGLDAESGGAVESVAEQPWRAVFSPAQAAILFRALQRTGYDDEARKLVEFLVAYQTASGDFTGSFSSAYRLDGTVAPNAPRWQNDGTGLALWTIMSYAESLPDHAAKKSFLEPVYAKVKPFMAQMDICRDMTTPVLPCPTYEGDSTGPKQTLRGAVGMGLMLVSAARIARMADEEESVLLPWEKRALQLRKAIIDHYWDAESGVFSGYDFEAWALALWPLSLFDPGDDRGRYTAEILMGYARYTLDQTSLGGIYPAVQLYPAARALRLGHTGIREEAQRLGTKLFTQAPEGEIHAMGRMLAVVGDDIKSFEARDAMPNLTSAAWTLLVADELYGTVPEDGSWWPNPVVEDGDVDQVDDEIWDGDLSEPEVSGTYERICHNACDCSESPSGAGGVAGTAVLALMLVWLLRRRTT